MLEDNCTKRYVITTIMVVVNICLCVTKDLILGKRWERIGPGESKLMESSGDPWIGVLVCFFTGDLH